MEICGANIGTANCATADSEIRIPIRMEAANDRSKQYTIFHQTQ